MALPRYCVAYCLGQECDIELAHQALVAWVCEIKKRLEELFKVANSQEDSWRKAKDLYDLNT